MTSPPAPPAAGKCAEKWLFQQVGIGHEHRLQRLRLGKKRPRQQPCAQVNAVAARLTPPLPAGCASHWQTPACRWKSSPAAESAPRCASAQANCASMSRRTLPTMKVRNLSTSRTMPGSSCTAAACLRCRNSIACQLLPPHGRQAQLFYARASGFAHCAAACLVCPQRLDGFGQRLRFWRHH